MVYLWLNKGNGILMIDALDLSLSMPKRGNVNGVNVMGTEMANPCQRSNERKI